MPVVCPARHDRDAVRPSLLWTSTTVLADTRHCGPPPGSSPSVTGRAPVGPSHEHASCPLRRRHRVARARPADGNPDRRTAATRSTPPPSGPVRTVTLMTGDVVRVTDV